MSSSSEHRKKKAERDEKLGSCLDQNDSKEKTKTGEKTCHDRKRKRKKKKERLVVVIALMMKEKREREREKNPPFARLQRRHYVFRT